MAPPIASLGLWLLLVGTLALLSSQIIYKYCLSIEPTVYTP